MSNTNKKSTVSGVPVKQIHGVTYFKLVSDFPGDYTKNCGLLGNEIDENFYFLRGNDIKTAYTEDVEEKKILVLVKVDDEEIRVDITDNDAYKFRVEGGYIYITFPDGHEEKMGDGEGKPVRFLVEGDNVHIVTDATIQGDGSFGKPIGIDLAYRTGTLEPADFFIDLTCPEVNISILSGFPFEHSVVSKERVSRFGALYTYTQAKKLNEALEREGKGWRLPSREDWAKLLNWAEGDCPECQTHDTSRSGNFGCVAGTRLKSREFWDVGRGAHDPLDDFGMTIYPVGVCPETNNTREPEEYGFTGLYKTTSFWSSTEKDGETYVRTFSYGHDDVAQFTESVKKRFSIRLVRDIQDDFDITEYADILGDYVPVVLTTDGKQLWTAINVSIYNYEGFDKREITVPKAWDDVNTEVLAYRYYELKAKNGDYGYVEIDKYDLPSYAEPVLVEEVPENPTSASPEYIYIKYFIHIDMLTEAKFFYNAWDGERWHKRLLKIGESFVLLNEDYPNPCDTAATPYVTGKNRNHEWRVFNDEQTGLDDIIDTLEFADDELVEDIKELREAVCGLTQDLTNLSGYVESGFASAFTAIDDLQEEVDTIEEAVGLAEDGSYIVPESGLTSASTSVMDAISILDAAVLEYSHLEEDLQELSGVVETLVEEMEDAKDEIDNIEDAVGLSSGGTHIPSEGRFTSSAETIEEEILALDEVLGVAVDDIEELKKKTIEPLDESIVVEVSGNTTFVGVNIDESDEHIKLGENGLWFDGDFGLI